VTLALVTLLVYWRALGCGFLRYDDEAHLTQNPVVQRGLNAGSLAWAFDLHGHAAQWIPLTWLVHMLNVEIFGMNPAGHHFVNVLLHVLNTVLLFLVLRRATGREWQSAFVAALFAVHPLHVESVAWVAELKDVLSAFFWILTLGAYVRYSERPNAPRYLAVCVCFVLGLLAKPMLVTLPFALLLFAYWPLRRRASLLRLVLEVLPLLVLALGCSVLTYRAQKSFGAMSPHEFPFPWRLANAAVAYGTYLAKTVVPVRLAAFYPHQGAQLAAWKVTASGAVLLAISAFVIWQRNRRFWTVGWLWFLGTLVPTIGLVQIGEHAMADRFTYIPHIGLFLMLVWGTEAFAESGLAAKTRQFVLSGAAAGILIVFSVLTWVQLGYWHDTQALFGHTLAVTGPNYFAENNYAEALLQNQRYQEAADHFSRAIALNPGWPEGYSNLGTALLHLGQPEKAVPQFETALRMLGSQASTETHAASFHQSLGLALLMLGKGDEATGQFQEAVRLDPDLAAARYSLGKQFADAGDHARAIEQYRQALRIDPGMVAAQNNLAVSLYFNHDYMGAWRAVKACRALGFEPSSAFLEELRKKLAEPTD
jgi:protein O-mannosyl-transferase